MNLFHSHLARNFSYRCESRSLPDSHGRLTECYVKRDRDRRSEKLLVSGYLATKPTILVLIDADNIERFALLIRKEATKEVSLRPGT